MRRDGVIRPLARLPGATAAVAEAPRMETVSTIEAD